MQEPSAPTASVLIKNAVLISPGGAGVEGELDESNWRQYSLNLTLI